MDFAMQENEIAPVLSDLQQRLILFDEMPFNFLSRALGHLVYLKKP